MVKCLDAPYIRWRFLLCLHSQTDEFCNLYILEFNKNNNNALYVPLLRRRFRLKSASRAQ